MPSNEALIASILTSQKQRSNPLQDRRAYGESLMKQGASGAPLGSGNPIEGVARALTGVAGGYFAGQADSQEKDQDQNNISVMSQMAAAQTPEQITELAKQLRGGNDILPILGQIVQGRLDETLKQRRAGTALNGLGMPGGGTASALPQAPAAPSPGGGIPQPGYSLDNNPGNIRSSGVAWDGKGTPQNGFETFATPQAGANAQVKNFGAYVQANPNITVAQAIAKWSPSNENDTQGVIRTLAENTGINPGMPLAEVLKDPASAAILMEAQTKLEKGGLPKGYTADTFTQATASPTPLQGGGGAAPMPPPAGQVPASSPAGNLLRLQAQRAQGQGDNVTALGLAQKALEEDAKFATEAGKIGLQGAEHDRQFAMSNAEHDRQQNTATPNNEQALSSTFANRMLNSNGIVGQFGNALANRSDKMLDAKIMGMGIPFGNDRQSGEYQQAKQARNDFINAQLRRESGAAISDQEYERADQQYFPQPGDKPEVLAQKAKNRQLAVEGMIGNAGPTFKQSPTVGTAAQPQTGGGGPVSGGPQPGAVEQGYRFKGGNPADKLSWERVQ